MTIDPNL